MIKVFRVKNHIQNAFFATLICFIAGTLIYLYVSAALMHNTEESLKEIAKQGAKTVEQEITRHLDVLRTIAMMAPIKDPSNSSPDKLQIINQEIVRSRHRRMSIVDRNGKSRTNDGKSAYFGDREFFRNTIAGRATVTDPVISYFDGRLVVVLAVPIVANNRIVGVLTATDDVATLSTITDNIKLGARGSSFIINSRGEFIAHRDRRLVYNQVNYLTAVRKNPRFKSLARLEQRMIQGKTGAGEYEIDGVHQFLGFAPIKGTTWSLAVTAPKSQVLGDVNRVFFVLEIIAFSILFFIFAMYLNNSYLRWKLSRQAATAQNAIDTAHIIMIDFDLIGTVTGFNQYAEAKLGLDGREVIGAKRFFDLVPPENQDNLTLLLQQVQEKQIVHNFELPLLRQDGQKLYALWSVNLIHDDFANLNNIQMMGIDITERVKSEKELQASHEELTALYEQLTSSTEELLTQYQELSATQEKLCFTEERYRLAQEGSNDVIWDWDVRHDQTFFSNKLTQLLGYAPDELMTMQLIKQVIHPDDLERMSLSLHSHFEGNQPDFSVECRLKTKEGPYKWIFVRGMAVKDKTHRTTRMAGSLTDIDVRKANELRIYQMAYYDSLTGLPNHTWLYENAATYISGSANAGKKGLLALLDMDNYKFVNDTFGHFFGDRLLTAVGNRLAAVAGEDSIISRFSGDQFVIIIESPAAEEQIRDQVETIMSVFDTPFELDGNNYYISASMGIATFPTCGETVEELLQNADLAMNRAKTKGKRTFMFHDRSMNEEIIANTKLENSFRKAVANQEFTLFYQPLVDVRNRKIAGFEALIRWNSPEYGLVPPAKFIHLAEENGLIVPLGLWVLQEAAAFAVRLIREGFTGYISVNLSIVQLLQNDFTEKVVTIINQAGLSSRFLKLEITETMLMESLDENIAKLEKLKEKGIGIFLDDFGTGYSSLNYLQKLPIEAVKIDKSFIDDLPSGDTERKMIVSLISLAHLLELKVIAEGVETAQQFDFLATHQCDTIQGYFFGKPVTATEARALLGQGPESAAD